VALDQSFIGRVYPADFTYEVSREKIREFADAIGDLNPLCREVDAAVAAGYPDVIAPPTFAVLISMKANNLITHDPELGLDYSKVVHGDQRFTHHRPLRAGDRIVAVGHVDDIRSRAGNDFLSVRAELTTVDGEPVCTSTATIVVRGTATESGNGVTG
jgi:acyl dehydratase